MKLTKEHLESLIANVDYHRPDLNTAIICVLILPISIFVTGDSPCPHPSMFYHDTGH